MESEHQFENGFKSKLNSLNDDYVVTNIPFNFYTTSMMLQGVMEKPLEKKAGRNFGPPGSKKLIYFIDDMNMPQVRFQTDCSTSPSHWLGAKITSSDWSSNKNPILG